MRNDELLLVGLLHYASVIWSLRSGTEVPGGHPSAALMMTLRRRRAPSKSRLSMSMLLHEEDDEALWTTFVLMTPCNLLLNSCSCGNHDHGKRSLNYLEEIKKTFVKQSGDKSRRFRNETSVEFSRLGIGNLEATTEFGNRSCKNRRY